MISQSLQRGASRSRSLEKTGEGDERSKSKANENLARSAVVEKQSQVTSPASNLAAGTPKERTKTEEPKEKKNYGRRAPQMIQNGVMLMGKFRIGAMIGGGGFGQIYRAFDMKRESMVAIKVEPIEHDPGRIILEQKVLTAVLGKSNFPTMLGSGTYADKYNFIVMEMLGKNLSELRRKQSSRKLSKGTTFRISQQAVTALQTLHGLGFVHRDVKPSNMCIGLQGPQQQHRKLFLVDFGMVRKFRTDDGRARRQRRSAGFRGTLKFVSLNVHDKKEQNISDDFISLYYGMLELLSGGLPWRRRRDPADIAISKRNFKIDDLDSDIPVRFQEFYDVCYRYDPKTPFDYQKLVDILKNCVPDDIDDSAPFDWEISKPRRLNSTLSCDAGTQ